MSFVPHTREEIQQMLKAIGVSAVEDLFKEIRPQLRAKSFNIPEGKSEFETVEIMKNLAAKNSTNLINFLGAGFYDHYIPAAVDALASRGEFYTAYTPYQPECSQGWLQAIYEYQTAICELTGLDVSNASLYDGGTALYEAMMMAIKITNRKKIIVDSGVNFIYRQMLYTYTSNLAIEFIETPVVHGQSCRAEIYKHLDDKTAAVIVQNPNFFGAIDDFSDIVEQAHAKGALAISSVYPLSLGLLKTPAEMGIDIATGEGQSLGLPLSFGGPYLGFMAARSDYMRRMPGRIAGATIDKDGKKGYVLTLQAREQHIRREKATSNICSNEALCALRAVIYLSLLGKEGLKELARTNFQNAEYAKTLLDKVKGVEVKRSSPTFNEFTLCLSRNAEEVVTQMQKKGFIAGFPVGRFYKQMPNYLVVSVTEKRTKEEIEDFVENIEGVLCV
ncbi:MAG: aminomethyl-transferring glycine dehydrogenase subunit GcvPA [Candidatus Omnitrophica bacterium]|nr:aminomethyl-transferring glycine dehydrogenase subunit GcvPA [Candidatus Omnitrophota bacterium]